MATPKEEFLAQKSIAVVGVSRTHGFGNSVYDELKKKGYQVYAVNREAEQIKGEKCYRSLDELPSPVGGVLSVVPPAETQKIVADCARLGIKHVWMQQGSQSKEAVEFCKEHGISEVDGACILMYADPHGMHAFHRLIWKVVGKL